MASSLSLEFDDFQREFAPIPEPKDTDRLSMLLDVLGFLTTAETARFFNSGRICLPFIQIEILAIITLPRKTVESGALQRAC